MPTSARYRFSIKPEDKRAASQEDRNCAPYHGLAAALHTDHTLKINGRPVEEALARTAHTFKDKITALDIHYTGPKKMFPHDIQYVYLKENEEKPNIEEENPDDPTLPKTVYIPANNTSLKSLVKDIYAERILPTILHENSRLFARRIRSTETPTENERRIAAKIRYFHNSDLVYTQLVESDGFQLASKPCISIDTSGDQVSLSHKKDYVFVNNRGKFTSRFSTEEHISLSDYSIPSSTIKLNGQEARNAFLSQLNQSGDQNSLETQRIHVSDPTPDIENNNEKEEIENASTTQQEDENSLETQKLHVSDPTPAIEKDDEREEIENVSPMQQKNENTQHLDTTPRIHTPSHFKNFEALVKQNFLYTHDIDISRRFPILSFFGVPKLNKQIFLANPLLFITRFILAPLAFIQNTVKLIFEDLPFLFEEGAKCLEDYADWSVSAKTGNAKLFAYPLSLASFAFNWLFKIIRWSMRTITSPVESAKEWYEHHPALGVASVIVSIASIAFTTLFIIPHLFAGTGFANFILKIGHAITSQHWINISTIYMAIAAKTGTAQLVGAWAVTGAIASSLVNGFLDFIGEQIEKGKRYEKQSTAGKRLSAILERFENENIPQQIQALEAELKNDYPERDTPTPSTTIAALGDSISADTLLGPDDEIIDALKEQPNGHPNNPGEKLCESPAYMALNPSQIFSDSPPLFVDTRDSSPHPSSSLNLNKRSV